TFVHNGLEAAKDTLVDLGKQLVEHVIDGAKWLYQHNWFVQATVDLFTKLVPEFLKSAGEFFSIIGTFFHNRASDVGKKFDEIRRLVVNVLRTLGTDAATKLAEFR